MVFWFLVIGGAIVLGEWLQLVIKNLIYRVTGIEV